MAIATVNPATGERLREFAALTDSEVEGKLARAAAAYQAHRRTSFAERAAAMLRAAVILDSEREQFARLMTAEMGKPVRAARDEAAKCAWVCRYYAENAERFLSDEPVESSAAHSRVSFQPLGPVLAVMPWNFPFWQVFRFAAPALMAGNVGLLKHASNVPQCALAIEDIFRRAGFAEGVFQTLLVESRAVERVIVDPRVAAVTLTGSEGAGASVAAVAGRALKKTVLELGGSDPFVVMPSANMDEAVETAVRSRTINNGQSCIAAKRFIVHERVYEEFERRFVEGMESLKVGDPLEEATEIGPLATAQIVSDLEAQVSKSLKAGARLLTGGGRLERAGNYFAPTVLTDIPEDSPAYREELFGPVALLFRASGVDEAIRLANDTEYGLACYFYTRDLARAFRVSEALQYGQVGVNAGMITTEVAPFGGVKESGLGREGSKYGCDDYLNIKYVCLGGISAGG